MFGEGEQDVKSLENSPRIFLVYLKEVLWKNSNISKSSRLKPITKHFYALNNL